MFVPVNDRVMLRRLESQSDNSAGFIIPETAKQKSTECEVVSVSPFYTTEYGIRKSPPCRVGDKVLIGKYSGNEHEVGGETLVIVRWEELLAVDAANEFAMDTVEGEK